ncbi:XdhC family protein [Streptosporangium amethystogenes]|uniref:XdhC family protein n=1 Tax=Streptosporangium amethystogenes TaxID=2002 RepID=UPI0004C67BEF|nr:XdhC/CoxI family protein [Streptosporangium amethystogenes]
MREAMAELGDWYRRGIPFALCTVVDTWSSAPRPPGAIMAVNAAGEAVGSVSGGCVEAAVYEAGREVLSSGLPRQEHYGIADDDAFSVGLTCGGLIDVFVERVSAETFPALTEVFASVEAREPVAVATVVAGDGRVGARLVIWPDRVTGSLGNDPLDHAVTDDARGMLAAGRTGVLTFGPGGERRLDDVRVFICSYAPPPRLLVFGAIDFAAAVARIGKFLGYHVTVCDARPVFATAKRFPDADDVVVDWPHRFLSETVVDERTAICVLTHDPKFDVPLLKLAVRTPAAYIGVMGSRRTHDDRMARLREENVSEADLARLSSPIGLDLGGRTPEETAVAIAAEIIALTWNGTGARLSTIKSAIHR